MPHWCIAILLEVPSWRVNRIRMRHVPAGPESSTGTAAERTTSKVSFPRSGRVGRRDVLPPFAMLVLPDFFFSHAFRIRD
jgi:hypothetical protein